MVLLWVFTLPAMAENSILIVGDSLSTSYGIQQEQGWVFLLKKRLQSQGYDYQIINISISGATTSNGLALLPGALADHKPAITIIALGGNDGLRGLPILVIKQNLARMIKLASKADSKVLLLGVRLPPNYGKTYINQFTAIFSALGKQYDIPVVPKILKDVAEKRDLFQADGIHPTAKAQEQILNNVWIGLKPLLSAATDNTLSN